MSDNLKLGELITSDQQRDAIHIAVAPVTATTVLNPGQLIGFDEPGCERVRARLDGIGIVDPFLKAAVQPEQRFWMFLLPYTITSLRHDWAHPAFAARQADKAASEKWMEEFAAKHYSHDGDWYHGMGRHYTAAEIVEYATDFLMTGERHVQQGSETLRDYTVPGEFWTHFEVITGIKVADYHRDSSPFCCTC
jgi:hypothetical protein